jgi:hypothetical protein
MAGNDIDRETQASSPVNVTGGDEEYKADVIQDLDGNNKLFVKATVSDGDITISSNLRIVESQTQVNINAATYTTIYSKAAGPNGDVLSGFMLEATTSNYQVRLTVDGIQIFDVDTSFLSQFVNWNNSPNPASWISFNASANAFYFYPYLPMKIDSTILIEVKSNQGNRKVKGYYVQVAEVL